MKWADFGLVDLETWFIYLPDRKYYWFAPEIIKKMNEGKKSSRLLSELHLTREADICSAGAVLCYYLTKGNQLNDRKNSSEYDQSSMHQINRPVNVFLKCVFYAILGLLQNDHFARNVIAKMMVLNPEDRIKG